MLGNYFYHEIIRKTVIAFGTLFNDIYVRHDDQAGNVISELKVPVAYGPRQKFLARIQQQPDLNKATQITLPRMSFEINNISYDSTRKAGITQTFKAPNKDNNDKLTKVFMPVPYNIGFELNILCKLQDDGLQILEQILPFFQPAFTLSIDLVKSIGEKRDVPMVLNSINQQDDYEGDFSTRRALIYTLAFTAKTFMFGHISNTPEGLIRKVQLDYYSDTNTRTAKRVQRYTVVPKAKKDYNDDGVIDTKDEPFIEPGDDFGFTETSTFFGDSKDFAPNRGVDI
tara:strand:- start:281 stop:1132 length:852 start_codon:yes stop_codon:yes gene_type:complete